ncbi:MAG: copper homeostasis protein CutC [Micrococcaceae bacterium]
MKIEIAVQDYEGARIAHNQAADRIELCQGLPLGGLTPSIGLTRRVNEGLPGLNVHALIRPRPGDFIYSRDEIRTMCEDIKSMSGYVSGFVIGALTPENTLDIAALKKLMCVNSDFTFHRAFDAIEDKGSALHQLEELGFARLLTSGGYSSAYEGREVLAELAEAGTKVEIMAGGGLKVDNIPAFANTGIDAVHLSAKKTKQSLAAHSNVSLGSADSGDTGYDVTDEQAVALAVKAAHG